MARQWLRLGALTAAGLAAWLTHELIRAPFVPLPPAPATAAEPAEPPRLEVELPVLASLHATLDRPLFDDDRRPDPLADGATANPDQPDATKALDVRLSAVIVGADGKRSALVTVPGQERPVLVGQGDPVGGWRVDEIGDEALVLSGGGQRTVVPLRIFDGSAPKRATARPPAQRRAAEPVRHSPARAAAADANAAGGDAQPAGQQGSAAATAPHEHKNPKNKRN